MYRNRKFRSGIGVGLSSSQKLNIGTSSSSAILNSKPLNSVENLGETGFAEPSTSKVPRFEENPPENENIFDSQDSILPSQAPSQRRFFSQRSTLRPMESTDNIASLPSSTYESILLKCGVRFNDPDYIILDYDCIDFMNKLNEKLRSATDYPENVTRFLNGFQDAIKNDRHLVKVLNGCLWNAKQLEVPLRSQETLVKNFFMIDYLQSDLIDIFVDKMKMYAIKDLEEHDLVVVGMILSNLKFIDHVVHGSKLLRRLFEILGIANGFVRSEVIRYFVDVVDFGMHDEAIEKLMELLPNDVELLTQHNVETFTNMNLSAAMRAHLYGRIVNMVTKGTQIENLLPFIKFILNFTNEKTEISPRLIIDLRKCLTWNGLQQIGGKTVPAADIVMSKIEILSYIKKTLTKSKKLFDVWLKFLQNIYEKDDYTPIDLIVLMLMIAVDEEKGSQIEMVIKRKVKQEILTKQLLEATVTEFPSTFVENLKDLLEIIDSFLQDRNVNVVNFGFATYKLSFGIVGCDRRLLVTKLLHLIGMRQATACCLRESVDVTTNALMLLTELNRENPREMHNFGMQMFLMLDRAHDLTLAQYRLVIDLLCSLACDESSESNTPNGLFDHLMMLVRKQISCSVQTTKRQGVIGAIHLIDHMVWTDNTQPTPEDNTEDSNTTFTAIDDIPSGRGKLCAEIFEMTLVSTSNCVESLLLCFDELANILAVKNNDDVDQRRHIDRNFLSWAGDKIISDFFKCFITEEHPTGLPLDVDYKFCLNVPEENENDANDVFSIAINVAERALISRPNNNAISSVTILPALLNIIRVFCLHRSNGLEDINALPGCSILLPTHMDCEKTVFDFVENENDERKIKSMIDIHIHLVNWFRELINTFASQNAELYRRKLLTRLSHLIELENRIRHLLEKAPENYVPPICQIHPVQVVSTRQPNNKKTVTTSAGPSRKVSRNSNQSMAVATETEAPSFVGTLDVTTTTNVADRLKRVSAATLKKDKTSRDIYDLDYSSKEYYRTMDIDIIHLLRENFIVKYPLPDEMKGLGLGILEIKFILNDLVIKVESVTGVKKMSAELKNNLEYKQKFLIDMIAFLPKIFTITDQLTDYIAKNRENVDMLYTDEMNLVKICFGLVLRLLVGLLKWPEFKENHQLLDGCLRAITNKSLFEPTQESTQPEIAMLAMKKAQTYDKFVMDLMAGVHLLNLVKVLAVFAGSTDEANTIVVELCENYLGKPWINYDGSLEKGAQCNVLLNELLKGLFKGAALVTIKKNVKIVLKNVKLLNKKDSFLKKFPLFNKANFPLMYRILCESLIAAITHKIATESSTISTLVVWENGCTILGQLLEIIQSVDIPRNFILFLKHSHLFLKLFIQHGIPMIENCMRLSPERVNELLKNLQHITRYLHSLCCHSKAIKNTTIVAQIPFLRQTIEQLLFKVKAALVANNCSNVFWMGNLKNKDIHGEEILSQSLSLPTNDSDGEEDLDEDSSIDDDDEILNAVPSPTTSSTRPTKSDCF